MKKFLLSCFVALGIAGNAQISIVNDFEATSDYSGWYVGLSSNTITSYGNFSGLFCSGSRIFGYSFAATVPDAAYGEIYVLASDKAQVSNGQEITINFNPLKNGNGTATYTTYYTLDDGENWVALTGATATGTSTATCSDKTIVIPAGTIPTGNESFGFKFRTTKSGTTAVYGLVDNIRIAQKTLTAPSCTTISSPANAATGVTVRPTIAWAAANGATSYKVSVGTTAGGTNIVNNQSVTSTTYTLSTAQTLLGNTTYYVTVTAANENGNATGCTGTSFTTGTNVSTPYCGPLLINSELDPISNVSFAGIDNASSNVYLTGDSHEFFLNVKGSAERTRTYPITVKGNTGGIYTDAVTVFIDWNNDGDFADANETYFTSESNGGFLLIRQTAAGSTVQSTSNTLNITIPANAVVGETRMRIKKSFIGNSTVVATTALLTSGGLTDPCVDQAFGQVEDYTLNIKEFLAVSDVNKAGISVFPNPFTDVLKISDVKGVKSISVSDVSGREVKSLAPSAELNLSSLQSGLYIVNLKMEDGSVKTFKAIKK